MTAPDSLRDPVREHLAFLLETVVLEAERRNVSFDLFNA
jgi:hypothetical protein